MVERRAGWTAGRWRCCLRARVDDATDKVVVTLEVPRGLFLDATEAEAVLYAAGRNAAITELSIQLEQLIDPFTNPETT